MRRILCFILNERQNGYIYVFLNLYKHCLVSMSVGMLRYFSSPPQLLWGPPSSYLVGTGRFLTGIKDGWNLAPRHE